MKPRCLTLCALTICGGCMSSGIETSLEEARQLIEKEGNLGAPTSTTLRLNSQTEPVGDLLAEPLTQEKALQIALRASPHLSTILAEGWVQATHIAGQGNLKPLALQLSVGADGGGHWEWGRFLSINLWDLLTYPKRWRGAKHLLKANTYQIALDTLNLVTSIREAWIHAVAAHQKELYTQKILDLAHVATTIAERMRKQGNFHKLDEKRHSTFLSYARVQHAQSQGKALQTRERLGDLLGLAEDMTSLKLPSSLPPLPDALEKEEDFGARVKEGRLDVAHAKAQQEALGQSPLVEAWAQSSSAQAHVGGESSGLSPLFPKTPQWGVGWALPLAPGLAPLETHTAQQWLSSQKVIALQKGARSQARQAYARYTYAYAIAQEFQGGILPLSSAQSEENLLRYNAMLIGVFDLLNDTQEHLSRVLQSIDALEEFWLAHVGLQRAAGGTASTPSGFSPMGSPAGAPSPHKAKGDSH